jgi:hypothetical protein
VDGNDGRLEERAQCRDTARPLRHAGPAPRCGPATGRAAPSWVTQPLTCCLRSMASLSSDERRRMGAPAGVRVRATACSLRLSMQLECRYGCLSEGTEAKVSWATCPRLVNPGRSALSAPYSNVRPLRAAQRRAAQHSPNGLQTRVRQLRRNRARVRLRKTAPAAKTDPRAP